MISAMSSARLMSVFNLGIVTPEIAQVEQQRIAAQIQSAYYEWHQAWEAKQQTCVPENIRFERDPQWRSRLFSIQCAHDGNHWVWKATQILWGAMAAELV